MIAYKNLREKKQWHDLYKRYAILVGDSILIAYGIANGDTRLTAFGSAAYVGTTISSLMVAFS